MKLRNTNSVRPNLANCNAISISSRCPRSLTSNLTVALVVLMLLGIGTSSTYGAVINPLVKNSVSNAVFLEDGGSHNVVINLTNPNGPLQISFSVSNKTDAMNKPIIVGDGLDTPVGTSFPINDNSNPPADGHVVHFGPIVNFAANTSEDLTIAFAVPVQDIDEVVDSGITTYVLTATSGTTNLGKFDFDVKVQDAAAPEPTTLALALVAAALVGISKCSWKLLPLRRS